MRAVVTTGAAVRSARATRRDLLLEALALRHQLAVLARSNRRFRPTDRLLWLFLRWFWPRWREALVLIQPATVDRWHREGVRRCWRRPSRRPGRPRIASPCRDLIRRMAAENCLWGAPRIHGELLKLGITISERTVSRYLRGRPTTRSQTWRTFFANHFGGQTLISPVMFADAEDDDSIVDASDVSLRPAPSIDGSCASIHGPTAAWWRSRRRSSLGVSLSQHHLQDRAGARKSSGRDPPWASVTTSLTAFCAAFFRARRLCVRDRRQCEINLAARARLFAVLSLNPKKNRVVNVVAGPTLRSVREVWRRDLLVIGILANHT